MYLFLLGPHVSRAVHYFTFSLPAGKIGFGPGLKYVVRPLLRPNGVLLLPGRESRAPPHPPPSPTPPPHTRCPALSVRGDAGAAVCISEVQECTVRVPSA